MTPLTIGRLASLALLLLALVSVSGCGDGENGESEEEQTALQGERGALRPAMDLFERQLEEALKSLFDGLEKGLTQEERDCPDPSPYVEFVRNSVGDWAELLDALTDTVLAESASQTPEELAAAKAAERVGDAVRDSWIDLQARLLEEALERECRDEEDERKRQRRAKKQIELFARRLDGAHRLLGESLKLPLLEEEVAGFRHSGRSALPDAVRAWGPPSATSHRPGICSAFWSKFGAELTFGSVAPSDCERSQGGRLLKVIVTTGIWRVRDGVSVGSPAAWLTASYPKLRSQRSGDGQIWELRRADAASSRPGLFAWSRDGRVTAITVVYGS